MSKSPWGNVGAWAADAERAEAEEREAAEKAAAAQPPQSFPSLKESVGAAAKQKKKTKMSLHEFTMQPSSTYSAGLTPQEMLRLPTGPKERSADDMQAGRLGGGFSGYGARPGSGGRGQDYEGRRSYRFQDDDRRGGSPRTSEMNQPSRADEDDNWGSMKRQTFPDYNMGQARPGGKYSSLGGGGGPGSSSRADDVDNWASSKKEISYPQPQSRPSSFSSGYSRPDADRWTHNEKTLVLDSAKNEVEVTVKANKANPFGAARPREEVLAEKGLDWKKLDSDIEEKKLHHSFGSGSRPASSQSSRPESPLSSKSDLTVGEIGMKQKPKVNPFGNAKPREVLLEEKGLDWKKIDLGLENRRVERPETEEEKNLKEQIEHLKKEPQPSGQDLILQKEQELETLTRDLDSKVRYSHKTFERPGSGSGRAASFQDRPYEEPRGGFMDRPRSRGGAYEDPRGGGIGERPPGWRGPYDESRPGSRDRPRSRQGAYEETRNEYSERPHSRGYEERGASHYGGGGRGYFGSRDVDRSRSRW